MICVMQQLVLTAMNGNTKIYPLQQHRQHSVKTEKNICVCDIIHNYICSGCNNSMAILLNFGYISGMYPLQYSDHIIQYRIYRIQQYVVIKLPNTKTVLQEYSKLQFENSTCWWCIYVISFFLGIHTDIMPIYVRTLSRLTSHFTSHFHFTIFQYMYISIECSAVVCYIYKQRGSQRSSMTTR